ncbi:MAG: peptidoglycan-binding domain-containing protein [Candidatus Omnitrophota bacterium]
MKRNTTVFIIGICAVMVCVYGCTKKQQPLEAMQQPMSPEELNRLAMESQNITIPAVNETLSRPVALPVKNISEPLPPAGPYKPTNEDIQTALKNAGYYTGSIDGKIGPKSKQAIMAFQKANSLTPDGKVGPKTWSLLRTHLSPVPAAVPQEAPAGRKKR